MEPAQEAGDLTLMRRLSLALCGTVPSLEEIRRFEVLPKDTRVKTWLETLLSDRRCTDYLAERFARVYVGTEDGPFILYRRRRFIAWLSDALLENRHYDSLVREMIADKGLWTDQPATNFVTVTYDPDLKMPTPERLAARVARAFLGVRIDCAQCHDHPFQKWKQDDFRGLASFFGGAYSSLRGIRDGEKNEYRPPDKKTKQPVDVAPCVPFRPELKPDSGSPREQLAAWVTDPRNPNFSRATVNRVWALLMGRPLAEPIDDLPAAGEIHPALDVLAADFASHDYDLHRLIRVDRRQPGVPSRKCDRRIRSRRARSGLGRLSNDEATPRASCRCPFPVGVDLDDRPAIALVHSALGRTPAATTSFAASETAVKMNSMTAQERSPSASCS